MIRAFLLTIVLLASSATLAWTGLFNRDSAPDADSQEISWEDLIPKGWKPPANPINAMTEEQINKLFDGSEESQKEIAEIEEILSYAPVEPSLDGKQISIPGYVVPLEFDGATKLKEFLLVPYMGACIHTPPPPANQVVYAESDKTITIKSMYHPILLTGTIKTETVQKDIAEAGYRLEVQKVELYEPPDPTK